MARPTDHDTRACNKCGVAKPVEAFPKQTGCKGGIRPTCKACMAEKTREWREADPERAKRSVQAVKERDPVRWRELDRARSKRYRERHPEVVRDRSVRYARANAGKIRLKYLANAEKVKARVKRWAAANPERVRINALASANRRRARKLKATPQWADHGRIKGVYAKRQRLQVLVGIAFHVDHIVPLQGRNVCGLHVPENLRVVPAKVNRVKGNRHGNE